MGIVLGVVVPVVVLIVLLVLVIFLWRRHQSSKRGLPGKFQMSQYVKSNSFSTTHWLSDWPDYRQLEFDRTKLEITGDLGEGEFGKVHLAVATGIVHAEEKTKVAVKTLKGGSSRETAADFRKELEILMEFNHPQIITLLGVCTKEEPLYIITELMTKVECKYQSFLSGRR